MYFILFLGTFATTSIGCFLYDYYYPEQRVNKVSKEKIIKDYKYVLPNVTKNIIISKFYFDYIENYLNDLERSDNFFIVDFMLWFIIMDGLFYSIHYLFHTKLLYMFHATHHEFNYTYGITAIYAHPIDLIFVNLVPITFPAIFFKFKNELIYFLILFSTFYTVVISHGGYKFLSMAHLNHHIFRTKNYGLVFSDKIFKTKL